MLNFYDSLYCLLSMQFVTSHHNGKQNEKQNKNPDHGVLSRNVKNMFRKEVDAIKQNRTQGLSRMRYRKLVQL